MNKKRTKLKNYIIAYWAKTQDQIAIFFRFSIRKAKALLLPIQQVFGFSIIKDPNKLRSIDISTYLSETDQKLSELPDSYRHYFSTQFELDEDTYIKNNAGRLTQIKNVYEAWKNGYAGNLAVVGEKGSGRTTFLNMLKSDLFKDEPSMSIDINQSTWKIEQLLSNLARSFDVTNINRPETLVRAIQEKKKRQIIYLEGLHNLYIRNINGFEALDALWLILSETKEHIFWVVSGSRYAWEFLNKAEGIETHFNLTLSTDNFTEEQIGELILSRHGKTDFGLVFEPDEQTKKSRSYKKRVHSEEELQDYLKKDFFEQLSEQSQGNASVAITLWLRSIRQIDEKRMYVYPFKPHSVELLDILNPETLFLLATFILHDTLKVAELSRILNMSLSTSRVLLTKLKTRGIITEKEGVYQLNHLIYRQILSLLKRRNIIH